MLAQVLGLKCPHALISCPMFADEDDVILQTTSCPKEDLLVLQEPFSPSQGDVQGKQVKMPELMLKGCLLGMPMWSDTPPCRLLGQCVLSTQDSRQEGPQDKSVWAKLPCISLADFGASKC